MTLTKEEAMIKELQTLGDLSSEGPYEDPSLTSSLKLEEDPPKEEEESLENSDWFSSLDPRDQKAIYKQADTLGVLVRNILLLEGKKGRGKSLAAIAISYLIREFFGIHPVIIANSMDLTESYGDFTFLDEREFISNLDSISKITKSTNDAIVGDVVEKVLTNMNIPLLNSCLIFDEAYKLFDSRTPSDKMVRVFGYFVAQSRHYRSTILLLSPNRDMIDKRVRRQVDFFGRCFTNKKSGITTVRVRGGAESFKLKIYGPNYYDMYNTHAMVGFRAKHLNFAEI